MMKTLKSLNVPVRPVIASVKPAIDGGAFPIKRVVGETVEVEATVFADGHDLLRVELLCRPVEPVGSGITRNSILEPGCPHPGIFRPEGRPAPEDARSEWAVLPMKPHEKGRNRWVGAFTVTVLGRHEYSVRAWVDHFGSWRAGLAKKHEAGQKVQVELLEGAELAHAAASRARGRDRAMLLQCARRLAGPAARAVKLALSPDFEALMQAYPDRRHAVIREPVLEVMGDPIKARFSTWYEFFPRSRSSVPGRHGTFRDAERMIPYVAGMGFDVIYLPPIHPIGTAFRKGRNNALVAAPADPGSPWGIGSPAGGHKDTHPETVFLAEAFTYPAMMFHLAKLGFAQSYTYFSWRTGKTELQRYVEELTRTEVAEYYQPNFWPNTPDILPKHLQRKDPAMYKVRYALAATLSSSCGIYGPAYELLDHKPFQKGGEEYADSEKYECKTWNLKAPHSIRPFIAAINRIRRAHPALQATRNVEFVPTDNDRVLAYEKTSADGRDRVLVCAALDPRRREAFTLTWPETMKAMVERGMRVKELLSGKRGVWKGRRRVLTIDPEKCPVAIWGMGR